MSVAKVLLAIVVAFLVAGLLVGGCVYKGYARVNDLDQAVETQWAEIDNQLQRRFDLIPNLVETVKGVAGQEKDVFLGIAKSREAYFQAKTVREKASAAGTFESALSRLMVLRETYPELKSNEAFLKLQDQVEGTENRLTVARKRYNDMVGEVNRYIRRFPGSMYAGMAGVEKAEYFKIEEPARTAPKVDFSGIRESKPTSPPPVTSPPPAPTEAPPSAPADTPAPAAPTTQPAAS